MAEDLLHGVEVVPPHVPIDRGGLDGGAEDELASLRLGPLRVDRPGHPLGPPRLLGQEPDWVGHVVIPGGRGRASRHDGEGGNGGGNVGGNGDG